MKISYWIFLLLAGAAVSVADVFLKQSAKSGIGFLSSLKSPWFLGALILYVFQVIVFTYLFVSGVKLSLAGIIFIILYSLIVLAGGYFIFNETLDLIQYIGIALAVIGLVLINL